MLHCQCHSRNRKSNWSATGGSKEACGFVKRLGQRKVIVPAPGTAPRSEAAPARKEQRGPRSGRRVPMGGRCSPPAGKAGARGGGLEMARSRRPCHGCGPSSRRAMPVHPNARLRAIFRRSTRRGCGTDIFDLDRRRSPLAEVQGLGCLAGNVHDAMRGKRPAVVDPHDHREWLRRLVTRA